MKPLWVSIKGISLFTTTRRWLTIFWTVLTIPDRRHSGSYFPTLPLSPMGARVRSVVNVAGARVGSPEEAEAASRRKR